MSKIGLIGLGKLGLCLALNLEQKGFEVFGYDRDSERQKSIANKQLKTTEPQVEELLAQASKLWICESLEQLFEQPLDVVFVVVPTPSLPSGEFDHSIIDDIVRDILNLETIPEKCALVINSTTMPGYCNTIEPLLAERNIELVYNPEFIAQGSIIRDQLYPDQVLIGSTSEHAGKKVETVYRAMCENTPEFCHMGLQSAEMSKLATNCFLTMKISFANHMGDLAKKVGADADKILSCIGADSRIGKKYLRYGYGFGGPCFPRDNQAMLAFSNGVDHELHLSRATIQVNEEHLAFQLNQLLKEEKEAYYFDNVAYKPGTDILEESQQLKLALALVSKGKTVRVKADKSLQDQIVETYGDVFQFET